MKDSTKKILKDAIKAFISVLLGALFGSCTVHHLSITHVGVPDSSFIHVIDNSLHSIINSCDSIVNFNTYDYK